MSCRHDDFFSFPPHSFLPYVFIDRQLRLTRSAHHGAKQEVEKKTEHVLTCFSAKKKRHFVCFLNRCVTSNRWFLIVVINILRSVSLCVFLCSESVIDLDFIRHNANEYAPHRSNVDSMSL